MKKKKIISAIAAVAVVTSLTVGSLAWFTSNDSVTNAFSTGGTNNPENVNAGIEINEDFDSKGAQNILPGATVKKLVAVDSVAKYDQLVRVNLTKVFKFNGKIVDKYVVEDETNANGEKVKKITFYNSKDSNPPKTEGKDLNTDYIKLNLSKNSSWTGLQSDKYYYYTKVLSAGGKTEAVLDNVTLSKEAGNEYKNLSFDVVVNAESIQASNGAAKDAWTGAPQEVINLGNQ